MNVIASVSNSRRSLIKPQLLLGIQTKTTKGNHRSYLTIAKVFSTLERPKKFTLPTLIHVTTKNIFQTCHYVPRMYTLLYSRYHYQNSFEE